MTELTVQWNGPVGSGHDEFGLENALAQHVRRRWPKNTVCEVQRTFDLSEGEAKNVVYAQGSKRALNKALRRGGWPLAIVLAESVLGQSLRDFVDQERRKSLEASATLRSLGRDLSALRLAGPAGDR